MSLPNLTGPPGKSNSLSKLGSGPVSSGSPGLGPLALLYFDTKDCLAFLSASDCFLLPPACFILSSKIFMTSSYFSSEISFCEVVVVACVAGPCSGALPR